MRTMASGLLILVGFAVLFSACAQPTQPTPTAMPELGLRRKGLSASQVEMRTHGGRNGIASAFPMLLTLRRGQPGRNVLQCV